MFQSYLDNIPKCRESFVNQLDIEDITLPSCTWSELDEVPELAGGDSLDSCLDLELMVCAGDTSSDSSLALSRAMTDSEIEYGRYHRIKNKSSSELWDEMRLAMERFPPNYFESLEPYYYEPSVKDSSLETRYYYPNEDLKEKMDRFFEECVVFQPDDPSLLVLEEALDSLDSKFWDSLETWC